VPSKTQQALHWLQQNAAASPYRAAREFGLSPSTVTRALKNLESTRDARCPCCGQIVRDAGTAPPSG
jgi:DeoR/GlpR family transcriptional regulator of sugar metabolism